MINVRVYQFSVNIGKCSFPIMKGYSLLYFFLNVIKYLKIIVILQNLISTGNKTQFYQIHYGCILKNFNLSISYLNTNRYILKNLVYIKSFFLLLLQIVFFFFKKMGMCLNVFYYLIDFFT